jgi:flagellar hook-associated protein 1 FlgK
MPARQALAEAAASLADGFRSMTSQLSTIASQTGQNVGMTLDDVNQLGTDLAALNQSIWERKVVGDTPNDLLDERDKLIDQLSALGAVSVADADGDSSLTITLNGVTLVDEGTAYTLTETAGNLQNAALAQTAPLAGRPGKLSGLVELRDTTLPGYQASLDTIAAALITNVNALQASNFDLNGVSGGANASGGQFFTGTNASNIAMNSAILANPALVAASANGQPANAAGALAQGGLRSSAVIGASTIDTAYAQLVTTVGSDAVEAQKTLANASALAESLENRRQSISGVSLDEEMVNLVRFQRAYQASARAFSAMDEMIELLVTRTGRVGL